MNVNVAGLNNLVAFKPQTAAAKSSSGKDPKGSSFEDVLDQAKPVAAPGEGQATTRKKDLQQVRPDQTEDGNGQMTSSDVQGDVQADVDVEGTGLDGASMPGQGLPANISAPLTDRVPTDAMVMGQPANKAALLNNGKPNERGVDSLTRRVVWNDFLRKMKEEFGVSADDVLQAFASLSDEELAKPPAETVDKIVLALGLNDQQAIHAKRYFQDLIQKTQSRSMGEELSASSRQISLSLMSEREMQRKAMDRSLQQMNSSFFLTGPNARPLAVQTAPNMETSKVPNSVRVEDAKSDDQMSLAALEPQLTAAPLSVPAAVASATSTAKPVAQQAPVQHGSLDDLAAQMQPVDGKDKSIEQLVQKFMQGQAPLAKAAHVSQAAAPTVAPVMAAASAAPAAPAAPALSASAMNGLLAALDKSSSAGEQDDGDEFSDASYLNAPLADAKLAAPLNTGGDFQTQLAQVKPGAPMAPADLVQQAQIMVRDGGGEMKVTMSPEGLGEVAMRVSVDNGKVNVQMITESDEAKKMIERSLGELKTQLSHNQLQVSDIKVDTATNLGKQLEQQYQDAQRQQAQAQWEQFRQDNQGWRRSFFETASAREYKGQAEAPRDRATPSVSASSAAAKRYGSRRLNLVA